MTKTGESQIRGRVRGERRQDNRQERRAARRTGEPWFRIRDTYGVSIRPGQNDILILAVTVAVDMMADSGR